MANKFSINTKCEELRLFDVATLSGTPQIVGSEFEHRIIKIKIHNDSDVAVTFSYNTTGDFKDEDYLPAGAAVVYDEQANRNHVEGLGFEIGKGVYVSGSAGTGTIAVTAFYQG